MEIEEEKVCRCGDDCQVIYSFGIAGDVICGYGRGISDKIDLPCGFVQHCNTCDNKFKCATGGRFDDLPITSLGVYTTVNYTTYVGKSQVI